jgi:Fe-S cluster biogenesis protein NfuA
MACKGCQKNKERKLKELIAKHLKERIEQLKKEKENK